ncbi:hypothetical protein PPH41_24550, partial [Burkholderia gladioli]|nr:hypothetical protein [Burkholderia gladioli]
AAGRIVAQRDGDLSLRASGRISSSAGTTAQGEAGGLIGSNGNAVVQAGALLNSGTVTAAAHLDLTVAGALDNSGGSLNAATLAAHVASLGNAAGVISAAEVSLTAPRLDNSGGRISANTLSLAATDLLNEHGTLMQVGPGTTRIDVSGTLDNANGGLIQADSTDLSLAPASLDNDGGTITHAGAGTLGLDAGGGAGSFSNLGGSIASNGQIALAAGRLDNTRGTISAQTGLTAQLAGALDNTQGKLASNLDLSIVVGAALNNSGGTWIRPPLALSRVPLTSMRVVPGPTCISVPGSLRR